MDQFAGSIEKALSGALKKSKAELKDIRRIGVGCTGQIELSTGDMLDSPHIPWKRIPLTRMIEQRTGKRVSILNDVQSAAWGEFSLGAGAGAHNMVCIFAGTGIGSGIVIEKKLYRGSAGCAGEVGHTSYRVGGVKCQCGRRGCAEAYCGGESLWLRARSAIKKGQKTIIADMIKDLDHIPADVIAKAAKKGDPFAKKLWRDAELALGTVVHNYLNLLNPDVLVLGGGIVEGLPYLRDFVRDYVDRRAIRNAAKIVKIVPPKLGVMSGAVGAANMAFVDSARR
jgi:glucokinase